MKKIKKKDPEEKKTLETKKRSKKEVIFGTLKFILSTLKLIGKSILIFMIILFFPMSLFVVPLYSKYAMEFDKATPKQGSTQTIFYDKDGNVIYESFGSKEPSNVNLNQISDVVKKATLAAEDVDFYKHGPIDIKGILRAVYENYTNSDKQGISKIFGLFDETEYSQGGSTNTQQLVKTRYLSNERSFERKIKELVYSIELEKKYSKDQILQNISITYIMRASNWYRKCF
jgi:penicillin-binding protein 1A